MRINDVFPWLTSPPAMEREWSHSFAKYTGHEDWVRSVAFSRDGKYIISGSDDLTVRVWDVDAGTTQHGLKIQEGWIRCVAISSRGIIAAGSDDSSITMWDLATGREVKRFTDLPGRVYALCFSEDGSKLATATRTTLRIWDLDSPPDSTLSCLDIVQNKRIKSIAFGRGDRIVATGSDDFKVRVWDVSCIWDVGKVPKGETFAIIGDRSGVNNS